ncbi:MAG: methylenetetrahydrofolate reductase [NAD(P)H] [Thioalkalivibrionaceae bacterium]
MSGFSFEFFPPRNAEGVERLRETRKTLAVLQPEYFSVTFGAGGSTRDGTRETVEAILREDRIPPAPHLSCVSSTRHELRQMLDHYSSIGVRRIVALRGDLPSGTGGSHGDFRHAAELVAFIREHYSNHFRIEVAAYPEMHPQAPNAQRDLDYFIAKVNAGADAAITQYFFNVDAYTDFIERLRAQQCDVPVIPGIMPILNASQLLRFSDACGAEIPRYIRKRLESFADDGASIQAFGLDVVTRLCERLLAEGAPGLHFYSMNQARPMLELWKRLGLDPRTTPTQNQ